ncbi:glycosyltransferase family A protein [Microbacterium sp. NPDC003461]
MASRRAAGAWATPAAPAAPFVDVLIPTAGRVAELAVTLAGLAAQDDPPFRVIVSDQSDDEAPSHAAVAAMRRVLQAQGRERQLAAAPPLRRRHRQRRLGAHGRRPGERDRLEPAHHLVLVVHVRQRALERRGVRRRGAHGVPRAEREEEGVRVPPAAVHLAGEVEALGPHPSHERARGARVVLMLAPVHPPGLRQHLHARDRARPAAQQRGVHRRAQQHDLGLRVRLGQRIQRRQGEQQVTQTAAAQHGDLQHLVESAVGRRRLGGHPRRPHSRSPVAVGLCPLPICSPRRPRANVPKRSSRRQEIAAQTCRGRADRVREWA